jgi:hypothetical protein
MKKIVFLLCFVSAGTFSICQEEKDSLDAVRLSQMISLSEVVLRSGLDVPAFIARVKNDTTFYKAFRSLHLVGYTSLNDIRIVDKKNKQKASLQSKTRQNRIGNCRTMDVLEEKATGNFYDKKGDYNYYTAGLYAGLFFTKDTICGEKNIVTGIELNPRSKGGIEKRKEQLKMLFFNPGKKIPGIPFIGDKIDIFDPDRASYYDFVIDFGDYEGRTCYVFSIKSKNDLSSGEKNNVVIDSMITWFDAKTMEIVQRNYHLSYNTGAYDFDVHMEVQMTKFGNYLLPKILRYRGNWDVVFKKRERGYFTATLFDIRE